MAGAVLHIGAHPDDEDVGLMAYMARKLGVRTVYWSATRGEGGENRIGPYREETLGVYRTWECLDARVIDGGEALFGPFYDYGYSKFGDEALHKWGRENLVREIVRAIRLVQPQIVVARWTGRPSDGHGHHLAIGAVTPEAFAAAGNPTCFPELRAHGLSAWQPRKLYQSTMGDWAPGEAVSFGQLNPEFEAADLVRINTGQFDPTASLTYQEQAWMGFNSYKTQAMGFAPEAGDFYYYYQLCRSLAPASGRESSLHDGLDSTLTGLADYPGGGATGLRRKLQAITESGLTALAEFRLHDPTRAAPPLLAGLCMLRDIRAGLGDAPLDDDASAALDRYLARKVADFEEVIGQCLGVRLECLTDHARVIPGQQFTVSAQLWNHQDVPIDKVSFSLVAPSDWLITSREATPLSANRKIPLCAIHQVTVAETTGLATPYWLLQAREPFCYRWPGREEDGSPFGPPQVVVEGKISLGDTEITLHEPVVLRETCVGGFRELPVAVVPPISLHPRTQQEFLRVSPAIQQLDLYVVVRSNSKVAGVQGELRVELPAGWTVAPNRMPLALGIAGDARTFRLTVTIPAGATAGCYPLRYVVRCGQRDYDVVLEPVRRMAPGLPGLPDETNCVQEEFVTVPAVVNVHLIEVKFVGGLKYAYIKGSAETILEAVCHFDLSFHLITDDELGYIDLSQFDAVVVGTDAYLVRDELRKNAARFLGYVEQGGTLIVLRQGYAYEAPGLAPYPLRYNQPNDEVTLEDAPVTRLLPDHTLLKLPNVISDDDFGAWVKDRGNFFLGAWGAQYRPILACNDPGEAPKPGGLVIANYGKGLYLYCAYSLFRQLPAGVSGAFRLFANLLAQPIARILEWAALLKQVSIFSFLSEEQLQAVASIMSERWEPAGVYLCRQGDEGDEMYVVVAGVVEILIAVDGQEKVVAQRTAGDVIGELAVLSRKPRAAAMRTQGEAHLLTLTAEQFHTLTRRHPAMLDQIILLLVDKLATTR
jgi:LmbE family N-acetylglucosaminyl deacetylase